MSQTEIKIKKENDCQFSLWAWNDNDGWIEIYVDNKSTGFKTLQEAQEAVKKLKSQGF